MVSKSRKDIFLQKKRTFCAPFRVELKPPILHSRYVTSGKGVEITLWSRNHRPICNEVRWARCHFHQWSTKERHLLPGTK